MRELRLFSKFMTLQTGKQVITIRILPNISRSTGNQNITQFEYNTRNIFLEKSLTLTLWKIHIFRTKKAFYVKQKAFSIILKSFKLPEFVSDLRLHL